MRRLLQLVSVLLLLVAVGAAAALTQPEGSVLGMGDSAWLGVFVVALIGLLGTATASRHQAEGTGRGRSRPVEPPRAQAAPEAPDARPPSSRQPPPPPPPTPAPASRRRRSGRVDPTRLDVRRVVVVPFDVAGTDPSAGFLAEGIAEEILMGLAARRGILVPAFASACALREAGDEPVEVARRLGARYVLRGSVARTGLRVVVNAALADAADGAEVWSREGECGLEEVCEVESELVGSVAATLGSPVALDESGIAVGRRTDRAEAQHRYLQGKCLRNQGGDGLRQSVVSYEQAVRADSGFAAAYGARAEAHVILGFFGFMEPGTAFDRARESAEKGLELDGATPEAWSALGFVRAYKDWDWERAAVSFRTAIEHNPSYMPARRWHALSRGNVGAVAERVKQAITATRVDPFSARTHAHLGWALLDARDPDAAETVLDGALELDPHQWMAHWLLGRVHALRGDPNAAVEHLVAAASMSRSNPMVLASLGHARARAGDHARAVEGLEELMAGPARWRWIRPSQIATVQLGLGRDSEALDSLERGLAERDFWLPPTLGRPEWDALRAEPRFQALVDGVGVAGVEPEEYERARSLFRR